MRLGPTPPLVSEELEKPVPEAWLYQTADNRREALLFKTPSLQLQEYRRNVQQIYESELFSSGSLDGFAQDAVQAEQDLIVPLIEKCATLVIQHIEESNEKTSFAVDLIEGLAELRRFVIRGRNSGYKFSGNEPPWWLTESDAATWKLYHQRNLTRHIKVTNA